MISDNEKIRILNDEFNEYNELNNESHTGLIKKYLKFFIKKDRIDNFKLIKIHLFPTNIIDYILLKAYKYNSLSILRLVYCSKKYKNCLYGTKIYKYLYTYKNINTIHLFIKFINNFYSDDIIITTNIILDLLDYFKNKKSSLYKSLKYLKHTYLYDLYNSWIDDYKLNVSFADIRYLHEYFEFFYSNSLDIIIYKDLEFMTDTQILYLLYTKYFVNNRNCNFLNNIDLNKLLNKITPKCILIYEDINMLDHIYIFLNEIRILTKTKKIVIYDSKFMYSSDPNDGKYHNFDDGRFCILYKKIHIFVLSVNNKFTKKCDLNKIKNIKIKKLLLYTIILNIIEPDFDTFSYKLRDMIGIISIKDINYNLYDLAYNIELYDFKLDFVVNTVPEDFFETIYYLVNKKTTNTKLENIIINNIYESNIVNTIEYTNFINNKI